MEMSATFRRDIGVLPDVFDLVGRFFSTGGIDPAFRFPIDFVLEEIFTNFVKYNPAGKSDIAIRLTRLDDELKVALIDFDSDPFDLHKDAPEVDTSMSLQERTPGRLGVHLVKKLMDRVEYAHEDRVSTITLYKQLR
jgi:anti-sigma regulatory factor (Ser/Thr protein kinase)